MEGKIVKLTPTGEDPYSSEWPYLGESLLGQAEIPLLKKKKRKKKLSQNSCPIARIIVFRKKTPWVIFEVNVLIPIIFFQKRVSHRP
jgi:hypothetical protein